ncbi:MAG: hypothetical protein CL477_08730 [Acidobacteria bacterium]|nr:hypothetical protein [Acidobacteriota bacterium]
MTATAHSRPRLGFRAGLPRRLDDRPDLQSVWHFNTTTPLQRPERLADKALYTEEEHAAGRTEDAQAEGPP